MSNFDQVSAEYLRERYGPFQATIHSKVVECDLCGERIRKCIELRPEKVDKVLHCCMGECLPFMVGVDKSIELRYNASIEKGGLTSLVSMDGVPLEDIEAQVKQAKLYVKAGFGKHWSVIPKILRYYSDHGRLSFRQLDTVRKFNFSCKRESEKS